jgi:uncharacterized membrane protein YcgQ (UPF0703/DUF1980 family)
MSLYKFDLILKMNSPSLISVMEILYAEIRQYLLKCNYIEFIGFIGSAVSIDQLDLAIDKFIIDHYSIANLSILSHLRLYLKPDGILIYFSAIGSI